MKTLHWKFLALGGTILLLGANEPNCAGDDKATANREGTTATRAEAGRETTGATGTTTHRESTMGMDPTRHAFMQVHHVNVHEIQMGELAKTNASKKEVKDFADVLIRDHRAADEKLMALAKTRNIDLSMMGMEHGMMGKGAHGGATGSAGMTAEPGMGTTPGADTRGTVSGATGAAGKEGSARSTAAGSPEAGTSRTGSPVAGGSSTGAGSTTASGSTTAAGSVPGQSAQGSQSGATGTASRTEDASQGKAMGMEMMEMKQQMERLRALKGAEFEREFLSAMVAGHTQALAMIDRLSGELQDTELKSQLMEFRPKVEQHKTTAQSLLEKMGSVDRKNIRGTDKSGH